jgi:molybdate transport system ATP-binding protein
VSLSENLSANPSASTPHLSVRIQHRLGALTLDVAFALTQPWTVLFGPSGSGKTTVLRMIAGFVRPDAGTIVAGPHRRTLVDTNARVFVPPHERPVRTAGQSGRLFPHMTIRQNIAYGVGEGSKINDSRAPVDEVLELFCLNEFAERMPHDLSGGERQKVLVARAAASAVTGGKKLLLLDEPFNGLDLRVRDELVEELHQWLSRWKTPVLSVTHDVGEAFQLDAEVIKIKDGRVAQQGPVAEVLAGERERLLDQLNASNQSPT